MFLSQPSATSGERCYCSRSSSSIKSLAPSCCILECKCVIACAYPCSQTICNSSTMQQAPDMQAEWRVLLCKLCLHVLYLPPCAYTSTGCGVAPIRVLAVTYFTNSRCDPHLDALDDLLLVCFADKVYLVQ